MDQYTCGYICFCSKAYLHDNLVARCVSKHKQWLHIIRSYSWHNYLNALASIDHQQLNPSLYCLLTQHLCTLDLPPEYPVLNFQVSVVFEGSKVLIWSLRACVSKCEMERLFFSDMSGWKNLTYGSYYDQVDDKASLISATSEGGLFVFFYFYIFTSMDQVTLWRLSWWLHSSSGLFVLCMWVI